MLNSLMVFNTTFLLMSLGNSFPFCIIKHTKRSLIKWGWTINAYITLRKCIASFYNNRKIPKVRVICRVNCKIVMSWQNLTNVLTNYMMRTLFMVKIMKLLKWKILSETKSFYEGIIKQCTHPHPSQLSPPTSTHRK